MEGGLSMSLDLSEYVGKYIPLEKEKLTVDELIAHLESEGYQITKVVQTSQITLVSVNNQYQVTLRGYVRTAGRDKEKFNSWEQERKQRQTRKSVDIDNDFLTLFKERVNDIPFATWVKRKMAEEIYGVWQLKLVRPRKYELVNDMVLVDDGETISFCHISEFDTKDFKLWARIPQRSITENNQQKKKKRGRKKKGGE